MFGIFVGVLFLLGACAVLFVPIDPMFRKLKTIGAVVMFALAGVFSLGGSVSYNDAGFCQHIRTIFGNETSTCETGWYFAGWGTSTAWPHYITVAHTLDATGENAGTVFQGSIAEPYRVRLADNWTGDVTQTTRFGIPQDSAQFLEDLQKILF